MMQAEFDAQKMIQNLTGILPTNWWDFDHKIQHLQLF